MTTTKKLALATLLAAGLGAPAPTFAGRGPGGPGHMMPPDAAMRFPMILRALDLTDEQRSQVHAIMDAHRDRFRALATQLHTADDAVAARLFASTPLTATDLATESAAVTQARSALQQEGLAVAVAIRNILRPDQLTKAATIHEKMEALHAEMKALLGEPGPSPVE